MMDADVEGYIKGTSDPKLERAFAQQLRRMPEDARFQVIKRLIGHNLVKGLKTAHATLQTPHHFQTLLETGLEQADASSMQFWLKCVVPKLGFRRVVATVRGRLDTDPVSVDRALYWLPQFKSEGDTSAQELKELQDAVAQRREIAESLSASTVVITNRPVATRPQQQWIGKPNVEIKLQHD